MTSRRASDDQKDHRKERHDLDERGCHLHVSGRPHAAQVDRQENCDDAKGSHDETGSRARPGHDEAKRTRDGDRDPRNAGPLRNEVAPQRNRGRKIAESLADVDKGTARHCRRQFPEGEREAHRAGNRHDESQQQIGTEFGERRRQQINA